MLNDYIKTIFKAQQKAEQPKEQPSTTDEGLKILTPNQVIIIFPIALAQVQVKNNPQKFKNEIRKLLSFLCY